MSSVDWIAVGEGMLWTFTLFLALWGIWRLIPKLAGYLVAQGIAKAIDDIESGKILEEAGK